MEDYEANLCIVLEVRVGNDRSVELEVACLMSIRLFLSILVLIFSMKRGLGSV